RLVARGNESHLPLPRPLEMASGMPRLSGDEFHRAASIYGRRTPPGLVTCLPGGRSKSVQPLLVFLEHEQLALPPHARERSAVDRTRAVPVEGGEMICRPVAFVLREAV